jgi:two-component system, chemotaxis family, chemotaxis protein CheY
MAGGTQLSKRVLVVDDSATVRQQVAMALQQAGYEIVEAVDGADGLSKLSNDSDISMVICDINMPLMNGLEMIEQIARSTTIRKVPIVMLTTEGQPALIQRARQAGAKGWLVKPFKPDLLLAAVNKLTA